LAAPGYTAVPIVDILNISSFFSDFKAFSAESIRLQTIMANDLNTLVTTTHDILEGLKHVEVDSFVNVRVMDELGELPIPSTIATGLLVSAFAGGVTINGKVAVFTEPADQLNIGMKTTDNPVFVRTLTRDYLNITANPPLDVNLINPNPVPVTGSVTVNSITNPIVVSSITNPVDSRIYVRDARTGTWNSMPGETTNQYRTLTGGVVKTVNVPFPATIPFNTTVTLDTVEVAGTWDLVGAKSGGSPDGYQLATTNS
jgi:hypothetical protein